MLPESPNCFEDEFICIHQEMFRVCIGDLHHCDMITDCDDGSDEVDCGKRDIFFSKKIQSCSSFHFQYTCFTAIVCKLAEQKLLRYSENAPVDS